MQVVPLERKSITNKSNCNNETDAFKERVTDKDRTADKTQRITLFKIKRNYIFHEFRNLTQDVIRSRHSIPL